MSSETPESADASGSMREQARMSLPRTSMRASRSSQSMLPITPVEGVGRVTLVVVACVLVIAAVFAIRSLIAPLLLGACVAAMVRPWMIRLRRLGGPKRAAAGATAAVVLLVALPVAAVVVPIVSELKLLFRMVREGKLAELQPSLGFSGPKSPHELASAIGPRIADALPSVLGTASELALGIFVFLMTLYYALVDGDRAMAFTRRVSPLAPLHFDALCREFVRVGRGVIMSIALTAIVEGGLAGIAYFALGLPSAALLTVLTAVAALVPIGTVLVWGPVAAMLWMQGRTFAALVVIFTGIIVISGIDHLVRPQLARLSRSRVHPLLIFVGMFGGMASLGGWGIFAGPLVVALGMAAVRLWDREQRARAIAMTGIAPLSSLATDSRILTPRPRASGSDRPDHSGVVVPGE